MKHKNQERAYKFLAILAMIILVALVGHIVSNVSFNQTLHTVLGNDKTASSYLDLHNREDSTSYWLKRDFELDGKKVDLKAQTFDGTLHNPSSDKLVSWTLKLNIKGDCFINNAWCGTVEVHQFVGTERECVQTLDLRNYDRTQVQLDYLFDGDLLIPLTKGDYVIYHPSVKDNEIPIEPESELTMGLILYYLDDIDISDYQLDFNYHRDLNEGIGFYLIIFLTILWVLVFLFYKMSEISYNRAWKEMELRKSGISYMSDIYDLIYIVDLEKDELTPMNRQQNSDLTVIRDAKERLREKLTEDVVDSYREILENFIDLSTLQDRLEESTIACEYLTKTHGWCQARFIAMDKVEGEPVSRFIFTVQIINDEKLAMDEIEDKISQADSERFVRKAFLDEVSTEIQKPADRIIDMSEKIGLMTNDEIVRGYARKINWECQYVILLYSKIIDAVRLSAGLMDIDKEEYDFRELIYDVVDCMKPELNRKGLSLVTDITPSIPSRLCGDREKLGQIMGYLYGNAIRYTATGTITISVFGKAKDDHTEHLLISIKDTGKGLKEEDCVNLLRFVPQEIKDKASYMDGSGLGLNVMSGLLNLMGSELKVISVYGEGSEFYFEIEQTIVDPTPVGKIEIL